MEFAEIFTNMGWIPAVLLCVGMVFVIIEVFMPGFGFFGIMGSILIVAGVVVRIVDGLNVLQSITLILMLLGFFAIAFMYMIYSAKYGVLGKSGLFETRSSLDADYNKADKELRKLVGKSGKTLSVLDLAGKAKINGKIYDVVSINSYIEKDKNIKVVKIENNNIMVRKWFE